MPTVHMCSPNSRAPSTMRRNRTCRGQPHCVIVYARFVSFPIPYSIPLPHSQPPLHNITTNSQTEPSSRSTHLSIRTTSLKQWDLSSSGACLAMITPVLTLSTSLTNSTLLENAHKETLKIESLKRTRRQIHHYRPTSLIALNK